MKISTTITFLTTIGSITNNLVTVTGHEALKLDSSLPTNTKDQLHRRDNTSVVEVNNRVTTITLGQDVDYPPFAYQTPNGELAGFGLDIANGMNDLCDDINIVVVQEAWENCWTSDNQVGSSIASGKLDGCMTYTHSAGVRDERADFSDAILQDNQAAGLLTLLDDDGNPLISGLDNISGRTIIDVGGWAPTADALQFVMNKCTNEMFDQNHTILVAEGDVANDVALQMLFDQEGEAILLYASAASEFEQCAEGQAWNCTLWEGFGEKYAYVQTGKFGHIVNGTTLSLSAKGSGIREVLRPCQSKFMATKEYYEICKKHDLVAECFTNEHFPNGDDEVAIYNMPTDQQSEGCSDGYCSCPTPLSSGVSNLVSWTSGLALILVVLTVM